MLRYLGKGTVAGIAECFLEILSAVGLHTSNIAATDLIGSFTGKFQVHHIRSCLQGCRQRDDFENGSGDVAGLEKAVEVYAGIAALGIIFQIRHLFRVKGRRGDRTENLSCLVVIYSNGAFSLSHCLQRSLLRLGRQGQGHHAAGVAVSIEAIDRIVAQKLCSIGLHKRGMDITLTVTGPVEHRFPQGPVTAIRLSIPKICQHHAIPVRHNAGTKLAVTIHMGRAGKHDPILCPSQILTQEKYHTGNQRQYKDRQGRSSCRNSIHLHPSFPWGSAQQSWRFAGCPPP